MKKIKVFISGPMSGLEEYNTPTFNQCAADLVSAGFAVFNPAWLQFDVEAWSKGEMMAIDIAALSHCDAICFLPNAECSMGSLLEADFAERMGIPSIWYNNQITNPFRTDASKTSKIFRMLDKYNKEGAEM